MNKLDQLLINAENKNATKEKQQSTASLIIYFVIALAALGCGVYFLLALCNLV